MGKIEGHKVLYRKYRSKSFDEVVGQDHIVSPLVEEVKQGKIAHAYLFTGPRGVGKTSIARIFAFAMNDMEYQEQLPIDIIEIDGASNRRIDEIRDLKEKIHVSPVQAKYKVYIIDEVHMLTKEAFNALLKTLEEPPAHAVFILATTEVHKMPATIISRTQRHSFKPMSVAAMAKHLSEICQKEGIKADPKALETIAKLGQGSMRDAISLLDQASSGGELSNDSLSQSLGIVDDSAIDELISSVQNSGPSDIVEQYQAILRNGGTATQISGQIIDKLRAQQQPSEAWFNLIEQLIEVSNSLQPEISLEIALLRANIAFNPNAKLSAPTQKNSEKKVEQPKVSDSSVKKEASPATQTKAELKVENKIEEVSLKPDEKESGESNAKDVGDASEVDKGQWEQVLSSVKASNNALYSVMRMSRPKISGSTLILPFKFDFHRKQMETSKNANLVASIASQVLGKDLKIETIIDKNIEASPAEPAPESAAVPQNEDNNSSDDKTSSVLQAFGGGEVVQL